MNERSRLLRCLKTQQEQPTFKRLDRLDQHYILCRRLREDGKDNHWGFYDPHLTLNPDTGCSQPPTQSVDMHGPKRCGGSRDTWALRQDIQNQHQSLHAIYSRLRSELTYQRTKKFIDPRCCVLQRFIERSQAPGDLGYTQLVWLKFQTSCTSTKDPLNTLYQLARSLRELVYPDLGTSIPATLDEKQSKLHSCFDEAQRDLSIPNPSSGPHSTFSTTTSLPDLMLSTSECRHSIFISLRDILRAHFYVESR